MRVKTEAAKAPEQGEGARWAAVLAGCGCGSGPDTRCLAERHRRSGEGDPDPACATSNFSREAPDGVLGPATRSAIRDYERSLGLAQTGEPSKTLFDSLKEMRGLTAPATKSD